MPAGPAVEPTAWEGLEELRDGLRAFLVRQCPDENEIEDVIQETFLRAARYRRRRPVQSLRPWALRIALNVLANARRRIVRTQASPADEPFDPPAEEPETIAGDSFAVAGLALDGEVARELLLLKPATKSGCVGNAGVSDGRQHPYIWAIAGSGIDCCLKTGK
jgi:DNA-directed RNA polymerase specialized sigma24 family protein